MAHVRYWQLNFTVLKPCLLCYHIIVSNPIVQIQSLIYFFLFMDILFELKALKQRSQQPRTQNKLHV